MDRTSAMVGDRRMAGFSCNSCGTSYATCTKNVLGPKMRACCAACGFTGTHDERSGEGTHGERAVTLTDAERQLVDFARYDTSNTPIDLHGVVELIIAGRLAARERGAQ